MATTGEGAAQYEGGGAGGKFRKKPFRWSRTTPYDRPPLALRKPSFFSKLVDPASNLIHASAHRLFGVFRKRLPPPPQLPPEPNQGSGARVQETIPNGNAQHQKSSTVVDATEISELEQMLKQKTFTRSEIDRLTALLHARSDEITVADEDKGDDEPNLPRPISEITWPGPSTSGPLRKSYNEKDDIHAIVTTPFANSRVLEEEVASPAELAKAYMGSRQSKVSSSMLGLQRPIRQDSHLVGDNTFFSKSPITSLTSKPTSGVGVTDNGIIAPRYRGRSALYSMARTPFSRLHSAASYKGSKYGHIGPSSSSPSTLLSWDQEGAFGSKQTVLKRLSSVLSDDIGSVGPLRRTRQKPNLLSQESCLSTSGRGFGYSTSQHQESSSAQKLLLKNEPELKSSKALEENGGTSLPSSSYGYVPSKSTETANKILEHLERWTPKEKSAESRGEKSPTKLALSMLHGQALRSLEKVDSQKFLLSAYNGQKSEDLHKPSLPDTRELTSQKKDEVEETGVKKFSVSCANFSPVNGEAAVSVKETVLGVNTSEAKLKLGAEPPQKKRAFQMSAHEDYLELDDDDDDDTELVPVRLVGEGDKLESSVAVSKAFSSGSLLQAQAPPGSKITTLISPEAQVPPSIKITKPAQVKSLDDESSSLKSYTSSGFLVPTIPMPNTPSQSDVLSVSTSAVAVPNKELNGPPTLSFGPKNGEKVLSGVFPFSLPAKEPSSLKSNLSFDSKLVGFNSTASSTPTTASTQIKVSASEIIDSDKIQQAVDIVGKSEAFPSAAPTGTSATGIFSFEASDRVSSLSNGSFTSIPSLFSSSAPVIPSSNFMNQSLNNNLANGSSSSSLSPAVAPIFGIGSEASSSSSFSSVLTASVADISDKGKDEPKPSFGNIFVATSSTTSSVSSSSLQSSLANVQESTAVGRSAAVFQFSSSAASPIFGTSPSTTTSSQISSSVNPFASTANFGLSSSTTSSSATHSIDASTMPPKTSVFGSTFSSLSVPFSFGALSSSISGSSTPGFSLGLSSASPLSSSSTPMVFASSATGTTSAAGFSTGLLSSASSPSTSSLFGSTVAGSSSALASSVASPMLFGSSPDANLFTFGASSSSSSFSSPVTSSSTTPLFQFGKTAPPTSFPSFPQTPPIFSASTNLFQSNAGTNNNIASDQMNTEDTMAEDTMQSSSPPGSAFGQPLAPPGFGFVAPTPQSAPFQFGGQLGQPTPPNPFQASSSLEFSAGGSFSLGSGGSDKSTRKIVRVARSKNRKK